MTGTASPPSRAFAIPLLAALLAAILFAHLSALGGMVHRWNTSPMYSFGYMVPLVAAFLLWSRRGSLGGLELKPSGGLGWATVSAAAGLQLAGWLAGVQVVQQFAFLLSLTGSVLVLFGLPVLRRTWLAWAYLLLMIPFWDGLTEPLHLPVQRLSASVAVRLLRLAGIPAFSEDTLLVLPRVTIEVARACSGINYLVAVVALGTPLAYLYLRGFWRRAALLAGAVVIAAASNSLRVALIGLLAHLDIGTPLHGPFHVLHGLFVSAVGYAALFLGLRFLMEERRESGRAGAPALESRGRPSGGSGRSPVFSSRTAAALLAFFVLVGMIPRQLVVEPAPAARLETLPLRLGSWQSLGQLPPGEAWWQGADEELRRDYAVAGGGSAEVAIAHFQRQAQGRELVSHRSEVLHRAATGLVPLAPGAAADVNLARFRAGGTEKLALFWYEIDGRPVAGRYRAKWLTLWNSLAHGRNDGAIVVVLLETKPGQSEDSQLHQLQDLASRVHESIFRRPRS